MPKKRLSNELWDIVRKKVWERDNHICTNCHIKVTLKDCNVDHIKSGKLGTNKMNNLRTLCKKCHVLRLDFRHRGMTSRALKSGIIPPNWRGLVWED